MEKTIDKNIGIPYYLQLKELLLEKINNNYFKDGKIWSENEISEKFGITKPTVRHAFSELEKEGLVYKVKGLGTYIKKPKLQFDILKYLSLGRAISQQHLKENIKIVESNILRKEDISFNDYPIGKISKKILNIKRIRYINDEPMILEDTYFNYDICKTIMNHLNEQLIFYNYYTDVLNINIKSIDEYIEPKLLKKGEIDFFQIPKGEAIFLITRTIIDNQNNLIEFARIFIRGDKCRYHVKIK